MCFGKKPKMHAPKMQMAPIPQTVTPIADQTPKIETGAEQADATANKKRTMNPNANLSLFQIQLMPGATSASPDAPGANTDMS